MHDYFYYSHFALPRPLCEADCIIFTGHERGFCSAGVLIPVIELFNIHSQK